MHRPRFPEQFFELSSCGRFESKVSLVSQPRDLDLEPFDQPVLVAALAEFLKSLSQLFQGLEVARPEQLNP